MAENLLLSICLPVFDREKLVRKTLHSVFSQKNVDKYLYDFEVVISDNNPQQVIRSVVEEFKYPNIHYHSTNCDGFLNSFYAMTYANGEFIKLQNSQAMLTEGALERLIEQLRLVRERKPIVFYSNGLLMNYKVCTCKSFDDFIKYTSYWTSWSNSTGIWKEDFDKIKGAVKLNKLFPHTSVLFTQSGKKEFIVDDRPITKTQKVPNRGGHNKFHAFSVEYPSLIDEQYQKGNISFSTKQHVLNKLSRELLPQLYFNVFVIKKENYDATGFEEDLKMYFPKLSITIIKIRSYFIPLKTLYRRLMLNISRCIFEMDNQRDSRDLKI